jgi:PPOX class probable F420-dependent enzyme
MSPDEIEAFLAGSLVARLATLREDGTPHLTPVWFVYERGIFYFTLGQRRRHLRNLRRDPRATLLVDVDERVRDGAGGDVRAVMIRGTATIDATPEVVAAYGARIDARYVAPDDDASDDVLAETYELVALTPTSTLSWDFSKR